jgi:hypothetical protein
MSICDHRIHRIFSLAGPVRIVNKLLHCPDPECESHHETYSPEQELSITMPWWGIGWDVFAFIGQRRFARGWSVAQIRAELSDTYKVLLSDDAIEKHIRRYRVMVAARHQDPKLLADEYRDVKDLLLSIDGLQPEKGHETLYVVRELRRKRVWFAESLVSSAAVEVKRLLEQLASCIDRGLGEVKDEQQEVRARTAYVRKVDALLKPEAGTPDERRAKFHALKRTFRRDANPIRQHMAAVMNSFAPGLFVGPDAPDLPTDNYDLERWFRNPKGHQRRIHGHAHAGVRIVEEGPTLVPALDAHLLHDGVFAPEDLIPYSDATAPRCEMDAMHRRRIMRQARSARRRPQLLADLEARVAAPDTT